MAKAILPFYWMGGKAALAPWVTAHMPASASVYVEPFAGSAAVLLNLPRPYRTEVINDLDGNVVNFFRVLQNEDTRRRLLRMLRATPYSRDEYYRAAVSRDAADPVEAAWAFFVAQTQAFSGNPGKQGGNWSYSRDRQQPEVTVARVRQLARIAARLRRVFVESDDARRCIRRWDFGEDALFYVDPPYHPDTCPSDRYYAVPFGREDHEQLVELLLGLRGACVLSGYACEPYRRLEAAGWARIDRATNASGAGRTRLSGIRGAGSASKACARTESLWLCPKAQRALEREGRAPGNPNAVLGQQHLSFVQPALI